MTDTRYIALGDVVADELFPDIDLALRRGRHIDREDATWYTFLVDAQALLEAFYKRFGCELVHPADGYFYLLPTSDKLGRRHLSVPEMLVGQALTLLYLDPATLQHGGVIKRADALSHLATVMGADALTRTFNPKRKRVDERVAQETVRAKFGEALRRLSTLGFVDLIDDETLRLRPGLLRFAEPVRGRGSPAEALERLVARGELVLGEGAELDDLGEAPEDGESESEAEAEAESEEEARPAPPAFELPSEVLSDFEDFGEIAARPEPVAVPEEILPGEPISAPERPAEPEPEPEPRPSLPDGIGGFPDEFGEDDFLPDFEGPPEEDET